MSDEEGENRHRHPCTAAISFTFADGRLSTYTHAFPLMRQAGLVGHIAVVTDWVGGHNQYSWEQINEMVAAGWEVESHSCTHDLRNLTLDKMLREVVGSKMILEAHGLQVEVFNIPGGPWDNDPLLLPGGPFEQTVRLHYAGYRQIDPLPHPMQAPMDPYHLGYECAECYQHDQYAAPLDEIINGIDQAVAKGAWYNSVWHDIIFQREKHWPKFLQVVEYAAEHIRAGRLRCVTQTDFLSLNRKGTG